MADPVRKVRPAGASPELERTTIGELDRFAKSGRLFAVLDACDASAVPEMARELGERRAVSLYRGTADEMYWAIAPYLFAVDTRILAWIKETLWDEPWGIFVIADEKLETLRRHFRRFLVVRAPNGEQWYFRYYDPRVLRTFLNACSADELDEIFGPVQAFGIPAVGANDVTLVSRERPSRRIRLRVRAPVGADGG